MRTRWSLDAASGASTRTRWALDAASGEQRYSPVAIVEAAADRIVLHSVHVEVHEDDEGPPRRDAVAASLPLSAQLSWASLIVFVLLSGAVVFTSFQLASNVALRATVQLSWATLERKLTLVEEASLDAVRKNTALKRQLAMDGVAPKIRRAPSAAVALVQEAMPDSDLPRATLLTRGNKTRRTAIRAATQSKYGRSGR